MIRGAVHLAVVVQLGGAKGMARGQGSPVDGQPALVWSARPDGHALSVNSSWIEYTGLGWREVRGFGWRAGIHPDDLHQLLEHWRSVAGRGGSSTLEMRLRRFDGAFRRFLVHLSLSTDESGELTNRSASAVDIEDQKRDEDAAHANEPLFRRILDSLPALVTLWAPDGQLEHANQQAVRYFGKAAEALRRLPVADRFHVDDRRLVLSRLRNAAKNFSPCDFLARLQRHDGVYRWYRTRGFPLPDHSESGVRWYLLQTDVDDQTRAEALLAGEKQLLEMVATGETMPNILEALCRFVESRNIGCFCGVMLIDSKGTFEYGAAPSLPDSFVESIIGRPLENEASPCAMACGLRQQIIVPDISKETRWLASDWHALALTHGLHACWSTPVLSATGQVLGVLTVYYDKPRAPESFDSNLIERLTHIAGISIERTQSNTTLKRSEARNAAILNSAFDCIITIDHEGVITEFNPAAERTFGFKREAVLGRELADVIIPPSLREQHRTGFARYMATKISRVIGSLVEIPAINAEGKEFPVELAITRIPLDGLPSFTGYLRDISPRKLAEAELRRSTAFLAEAQKLSLTGSFYWNVTEDEHFWSDETSRIFEYDGSSKVTIGLLLDRAVPQDLPLVQQAIAQAKNGRDFDYECRFSMPGGAVKALHIVAHRSTDHDSQLAYIGAVQDVTERRLLEETHNKVRSELAHVSRVTSLGVLAASIAHEVSQPLAGIVTNTNTCTRMLDANPPNVTGARETVRRTLRDANRASDVITRLRALFGKSAVANEVVHLNEATQEIVALSASEMHRNGINLRLEFADNLMPIAGDRVQLQQVILNLLLNALDAMSGVEDHLRQLIITTENLDASVRLALTDSGTGFSPEVADRIFDTFYTTKTGGMGVGLSVSRSIIESHQGKLRAQLNDGPGATFFFCIPVRREGDAGHGDSLSLLPLVNAGPGEANIMVAQSRSAE